MTEWQAYFAIEPFGQIRSELRHGQAMAMTAELHRDSKKRHAPFTAKEFMNYLPPEKDCKPVAEDPKVLSARIARELFGFRGKR